MFWNFFQNLVRTDGYGRWALGLNIRYPTNICVISFYSEPTRQKGELNIILRALTYENTPDYAGQLWAEGERLLEELKAKVPDGISYWGDLQSDITIEVRRHGWPPLAEVIWTKGDPVKTLWAGRTKIRFCISRNFEPSRYIHEITQVLWDVMRNRIYPVWQRCLWSLFDDAQRGLIYDYKPRFEVTSAGKYHEIRKLIASDLRRRLVMKTLASLGGLQ